MAFENFLIAPIYPIPGLSTTEETLTAATAPSVSPHIATIEQYKWVIKPGASSVAVAGALHRTDGTPADAEKFRSANSLIFVNPFAPGIPTISEHEFDFAIDPSVPGPSVSNINIGSNILNNGDLIYNIAADTSDVQYDDISMTVRTTTAANVDLAHDGMFLAYIWQPTYNYLRLSRYGINKPTGYSERYYQTKSSTENQDSGVILAPHSGIKRRVLKLKLFLDSKEDFYSFTYLAKTFKGCPFYISLGPNNASLDAIESEYGARIIGYPKFSNYTERYGGYSVTIEIEDARMPSEYVTRNLPGAT